MMKITVQKVQKSLLMALIAPVAQMLLRVKNSQHRNFELQIYLISHFKLTEISS